MHLNERKIKILEAIINDYIHTAEPIGSRTIAKRYDLGISSATIRNEMSDLEDMGFIIQPHASSGRVPSDKGYRVYVDRLAHYRELTEDEIEFLTKTIRNNITQMDFLMQETAKAIALLTNYTTIASKPQKKASIKHIQLIPLDEASYVLVLVTDTKSVKNHTIKFKNPPGYEELMRISALINYHLQADEFENLMPLILNTLKLEYALDESFLLPIIEAMAATMRAEDEIQIYTSGVKHILGYREFNDIDKAKALFQTLEEKELLITLLGSAESDKIQISIGTENNVEQMKDCSLIKTNYTLDGKQLGSIGIIGPTRMDYAEVVSVLNGIAKNINMVIQKLSSG